MTDVGSVKASIVEAVADPPVRGRPPHGGVGAGGHRGRHRRPVRGCHLGAHAHRAPTPAYAQVRQIIGTLGAEVVALPPDRHDVLVAIVSHVPHLTAATLMRLRRRPQRGASGAVAAGGRWVPRHDPHRGRPPGHLARHLRRQPGGDRRRAGRADGGARAHAGDRGGRRSNRPAGRSNVPGPPGSTCRPASAPPRTCASCGSWFPTGRGSGRRDHPRHRPRREHRRPRDRPFDRGGAGRPDPAGRGLGGGGPAPRPGGPGLPAIGHPVEPPVR